MLVKKPVAIKETFYFLCINVFLRASLFARGAADFAARRRARPETTPVYGFNSSEPSFSLQPRAAEPGGARGAIAPPPNTSSGGAQPPQSYAEGSYYSCQVVLLATLAS